MKRWKSCAEWDESIPGFHQNQITTDTHETKEQAEHVCKILRTDGLGQEGRFFPIRTWVEQLCFDCGAELVKPYDNGDGNSRCETCAVKKYKSEPTSLIRTRPDIMFKIIGKMSS